MHSKKRWLLFAIAVAVIVVVSGVVYTQRSIGPREYQFGAILPLTGDMARLGEPKRDAIQMAIDEINRLGGIDGKSLTLRLEDSKAKPEDGVTILQRLIDLNGIRMFYVDITGVALSAAPIASARGVVMFAGSAHPSITVGHLGVFRIFTSGAQEAKILSEYLVGRGVKTAFVLYVDDPLGQDTKTVFERLFQERGGKLVGSEKFKSGAQEFRSILSKAKASGADTVAVFDYGVTLPQILQQARQAGISSEKITGNIGFVGPGVVRLDAVLKEGVVFTGPAFTYRILSEASSPAMQTFIREYEARTKKLPDYTAAFAYDTIKLLSAALKGTGGDPQKLKNNLLSTREFPGVTGNITILPNGDSSTDMVLATYKSGKIVSLDGSSK